MDSKEQKLEQFKGQTRLPNFAVPRRYDLTLNLDLQGCTFSGIVLIDISIVQATKFLVLNALELVIQDVSFSSSENHNHIPTDTIVDNCDEILVLGFDDSLTTGNGVLKISFSGTLNEQLKGLYRCTYEDGGEKKNMVVTQFEAVDARLCFPCWDEPVFKATFKITLTNVPLELTALSNMPVSLEKHNGHFKTINFEESVVMSTYLVAVVVGLFDYIEETTDDGVKVRVYTPMAQSEKGKFALNIAVKALDLFKKYFSLPYGLPKLDMVAVPEFFGAMENYGLIIYNENELLHDDLHSTVANTQRLTIVVAHEVAHLWFGNLVTMEWWTHLWLKEGFATWVSYLVTDILFPEWKIWNRFLEETTGGLQMDALEESHPIEVEIHHARSVIEYFDAISYKKGSAVIRMLQDYLGNDIFQKSLSLYMARYAWGNAETEDLWNVLSEISGIGVSKIMSIWTKQKGYPVVSLSLKDCLLEFEQTQFVSSGLQGDGQWIIPITLSLGSYNRRKTFLLESRFGELDISEFYHALGGSSSLHEEERQRPKPFEEFWIKANVHQAGFYRVKYDDGLLTRLRNAIKSNCLSAADEFGILDDTFALCEACKIPLSSLLSLMEVYRKDLEYITLSRLVDICQNTAKISCDAIPDLLATLKQFFINLLLFSAVKLGWDVVPGESQITALMREEVLMALVHFGHKETCEEALKRFQVYLEDRKTSLLPVDTRKAAYIAVMRNTSNDIKSGFEHLLRLYREVDAVQEKTRIFRCMATSSDPAIVLEVLNFMFSDEVRDQDIIYVTSGISLEGRSTAWIWLKENWDMILNKWGTGPLLQPLIRHIVTPFSSYEMADEVESFFASRMDPSIAMNVKQRVEIVRIKARWAEYIKQDGVLGELVAQLASHR